MNIAVKAKEVEFDPFSFYDQEGLCFLIMANMPHLRGGLIHGYQ